MRYTALILKGFKRFALSQVENFTIRPSEVIQLILGTNGSGKSCLLRELTPLPASSADYQKEGSKEIQITDAGHEYWLTSSFGTATRHSFLKDGEELNPGGTAAVQRELVRQTFGITPDTHELCLGAERFTSMGPARRREWFTKLSDVDYDYAIAVYNRLKDEWRNISGALKLDRKQLVLEQAKIITHEEQAKLIQEVEALHADLTRLSELREPVGRPAGEVDVDRRARESELHAMSRQLLALRAQAPLSWLPDDCAFPERLTFDNPDDVDRHIEAIRHRITAQEAVLTRCVAEHEKLKGTVDILKRRGTDDLKTLRNRLTQLQDARLKALAQRRLGLEGFDAPAAIQAFTSIGETLTDKLSALPANEEGRYSTLRLQEERERLLRTRKIATQTTQRLAQLQAQRQHMQRHRETGSVTCPRCSHVFTQGASEQTLRQLGKEIDASTGALAQLEKQMAQTEESVAAIQAYRDLYGQIQQIIRMAPALRPFWEKLAESGDLKFAPAKVISTLALLGDDLKLEVEAAAYDNEIAEARKLLAHSERLGDATLGESSRRLFESTRTIEGLTAGLTAQRRSLNDFVLYRRKLAEALALRTRIVAACRDFAKLTHDQVETLYRTTIHQSIRQVQSTLARKEEILANLNQQKAIVASLETTIATRTLEEEALTAAIQELSPNDGLIAQGLTGFIRAFTREMNLLIRKIWAYPLEILPCGLGGEGATELDYRFALKVNANDNAPDVGKGSTGMQEIVDVAFMVVATRYLRLDDGPLLLDEFGAVFDAEHRNNMVKAVKQIMETRPFSQLFMISHYAATYGAFSNVQTCVLDSRNIAVPKVYNTHVTMT